jgi:hypothetical protein
VLGTSLHAMQQQRQQRLVNSCNSLGGAYRGPREVLLFTRQQFDADPPLL